MTVTFYRRQRCLRRVCSDAGLGQANQPSGGAIEDCGRVMIIVDVHILGFISGGGGGRKYLGLFL